MPRKKKATPEKQNENPQNQPTEDEVTEGFPQDGDELSEPEPQEPEPQNEPEPQPDPMEQIRTELNELKRENQQLRQMIPPQEQKPQKQPKTQEEEIDWERLIFEDPNKALKLHGEMVAKQVRSELQTEYQRDQGTQRFWNDFYKKNPDLEEDRDLVELTLNSNLSNLANLPVAEAIDQLADLTRQRILRYSGGQQKTRNKKPVVEGAESPKPKAPPKEEPNVTSLSDLIKARKAKRTTAA